MDRKELSAAVSARTDLDIDRAEKLVDSILETILDALERGDVVKISGFGSFIPTRRPGQTSGGAQLRFRASPVLRHAVNQAEEVAAEAGVVEEEEDDDDGWGGPRIER